MTDAEIVKDIAKIYAERAHDPKNENKIALWKQLNSVRRVRPLVTIDQLPWEEFDSHPDMQVQSKDPFYRHIEYELRKKIFQDKYFACDRVLENRFYYPAEIIGFSYGIAAHESETQELTYDKNKSKIFVDQIETEEDLNKIHMVPLRDTIPMEQKRNRYGEIFDGILPIEEQGVELSFQLWDFISFARGVETCLYDMIDRPEFLHKILKKYSDVSLQIIDYAEEHGLIWEHQPLVHCTGAYTEDLPQMGGKSAKAAWTYAMSQIMSEVSPAMHEEFELEYMMPIFERFGAVYYGCCEPLHLKTEMIRKYPNVRKISMSPWANKRIGAEKLGSDYVMSIKPNPAFLAFDHFEKENAVKEIVEALDACRDNKTPCEIILKDLTTVKSDLSRLIEWSDLIMKVAEDYE